MLDVREIYDDKVMSTQALYNTNNDVWNDWKLNYKIKERGIKAICFVFLDKVVCMWGD